MKPALLLILLSLLAAGPQPAGFAKQTGASSPQPEVSLIILGTVQDAGSPQAGCKKNCCKKLFLQPDKNRKVVSLGLIDRLNNKKYLFEASPDISAQLRMLQNHSQGNEIPDGIFLTHAHIGHYTGLMYLGREAMNTNGVPVYTMPRMKTFLEQNGPWSQLVTNKNIQLQPMADETEIPLSSRLKVTPFTVPHRDEFSETVGYRISGPRKTALFIPDIDKWEKWKTPVIEAIAKADYAFIDGTFYDAAEINNRNMAEIPHPFITESMNLFKDLPQAEKKKIHFIHFNHTNPLLDKKTNQAQAVIRKGFNMAVIHDVFDL